MTTVLRHVAFSVMWACSTANDFKSNEGVRTKFTVLER